MNRSIDRYFGLFLLAVAAVFGSVGWGIKAPFSYDPLGPRPFPLLLAGVLAVVALWIVFKPQEVKLPAPAMMGRAGLLVASLIFYQMTFRYLGFIVATAITVTLIARLFKGSWLQGVAAGIGLALACYGLFNTLLEIPLPLGRIFTGHGG